MSDHFVYVISIDELSLSKVGISNDPQSRLRQLSTGSPFKLSLAMALRVPNKEMAQELEEAFHKVQKKHRRNGEWFNLNSTQACAYMAINFACALKCLTTIDDDELVNLFYQLGIEQYTFIFDMQPNEVAH